MEKQILLIANNGDKYSENVQVDGMVIMHVFNSSFWLIHHFDNNLYYDPLTVNHLFIFIMSRVVDENKVQLDLAFRKLFQIRNVLSFLLFCY